MPLFPARKHWSVVGIALVGMLGGCTTSRVEDPPPDDGNRIGQACTLDEECNGAVCVGGVCAAGNAGNSSGSIAGSSGGLSSGGNSRGGSGASGNASSLMVDAGPPPMGIITLTPDMGPIEFGAQRIGQSVEKTVIVANTGNAPFNIIQVGVDYEAGNPAQEFAIMAVGTQPTTMTPGQQFTLRIVHTPTDGTPDHAFLRIVSTAGNTSLAQIELVAEFKGDPTLLVVDALDSTGPNITNLDVGAVALNGMTTKHFYVKNAGAADSALTISSIDIQPAGSQFTVSAGPLPRALSPYGGQCVDTTTCSPIATACDNGLCVAPNAAGSGTHPVDIIDVVVTYSATTPGPTMATATVTASIAGQEETVEILLTGLGQVGRLVVQPNPIDFGDGFIGRPMTQTVTILNDGNAVVNIRSATLLYGLPAGVYTVDTMGAVFPVGLPPQGSMLVDITFTPAGPVSYPDQLVIDSTATTMPVNIVISGVGTYAPQITGPASLAFGNVYVGTSVTKPIDIGNTARGDLVINRVYVEGANASVYAFSPTLFPDPILRNDHLTMNISYAPQTLTMADDVATLVVETNDPDMPQLRVALSGRAVRPTANVVPTPTFIDFGPLLAGSTAQRTISIRNEGVGDLIVAGMAVPTDANLMPVPEFQVVVNDPDPVGVVLPGGFDAITYTITFAPLSAQAYNATFHLTTNDQARPTIDATLAGGGLTCTARPNATVQNVNGMCTYTCNPGFHACGQTCASDTDPDTCGSRCTPCETRTGTQRLCDSGTSACLYQCTNPNYDLNGDRNVGQGVSTNGCEYACAVTNPSGEVCDTIDNDCNGTPDDGLPVEFPEPSSQCSGATDLGSVNDGSSIERTDFRIYPSNDTDWFKIRAHENSSQFCFPGDSQNYETKIELMDIAPGNNFDLDTHANNCGGTQGYFPQGGNSGEGVIWNWSGTCSSTDNKDFFFRVFPSPNQPLANSCFVYRIKVSHRRT